MLAMSENIEVLRLLSKRLKALAEVRRMEVYSLILEGGQSNRSVADRLGMPANLVSYHLRILETAGLIWAQQDEVDARRVYYFADIQALEQIKRSFSDFYGGLQPKHN
jgi:DNA-binding MarR family transcriptional regulator